MCSPSPPAKGRSRSDRWLDSSPSSAGTAESRPTSYLEALRSSPASPTAAGSQPSPPPARPPLHSEICQVTEADGPDGWHLARCRRRPRSLRPRRPRRGPADAPRRPPSWLREGECPKCFSTSHPRSECRRDIRCGRCRCYGHKVRECTMPRAAAPSSPSSHGASPPPLRRRVSPSGSGTPLAPEYSAPSSSRPAAASPGDRPASSGSIVAGSPGSEGPTPASSGSPPAPASPATSTSAASTPLSGHPVRRPAGATCYLPRSAELVAAERDLERALIATVAGCHSGVSREAVFDALRACYGLAAHEFSVHTHASDDFLIKFSSAASRARVAAGGLRTGNFRLIFTPWSLSRDAVPVKARFLVSVEIKGIPDHAWHWASVEFLLSPFCQVENLAPETRNASDMSVFRLTAWTTNPDGIPRTSELLVPEHDAVEEDADPATAERLSLGLMLFPVEIHVRSCVDYRRPSPLPSPSPADGAGDCDAPPDSPPVPGPWPRIHEFPERLPGASSRRTSGSAPRRRRRRHAPPPCHDWQGILGPYPVATAAVPRVRATLRLGAPSSLPASPACAPATSRAPAPDPSAARDPAMPSPGQPALLESAAAQAFDDAADDNTTALTVFFQPQSPTACPGPRSHDASDDSLANGPVVERVLPLQDNGHASPPTGACRTPLPRAAACMLTP
ncbi:uncharacterized protein [Triticum aestivum]|uniref:uncharacterized protein n=1 Tax=Triticum aestivum TaxID=4565 RepID=UPI001D013FB7|nr:uncharacterized protein LOC123161389 [Triticum aestivum]XP_044435165.1 uncharacterized protein LOC123161389 [Triticum aestivum]